MVRTHQEKIEHQLKQMLMSNNQKRKLEYEKWEEKAKGKYKTHQF